MPAPWRAARGAAAGARAFFERGGGESARADLVVALYYGNVSDSGTAWECGYAYAKGVPVVLVHVNGDADSNLMMHVGCATNISLGDLETFDFERLPRFEYEGEMF